MNLLPEKIVCITGSSRGIGRATALECSKQGARGLILHYLGDDATTSEVLALKSEIENARKEYCKVITVPGDIADPMTSKNVCTSKKDE